MAHNEELAHKVRQELINANAEDISERKMFGGLAFMVNDKMYDSFIMNLKKAKAKYAEWDNVAKLNDVKDVSKKMELE